MCARAAGGLLARGEGVRQLVHRDRRMKAVSGNTTEREEKCRPAPVENPAPDGNAQKNGPVETGP